MRKTTIMRGKIGPEKRDGGPSVSSQKPEGAAVTGASWEKALSMFLLVKKAQGARERTIIDYRKVVGLFFKRFPDAFNSEENPSKSIYQHMAQKIKPNTYNIRLTYLKAFFSWCVDEGILRKNPLIGFKRKPPQFRIVDIMPEHLKNLLGAFDCSTYTGLSILGPMPAQ